MEDIRDIERSQNIRSRNSFLGKKNALIALGILAISASVIIIACSRGYLSSPVTHVAHSNTNPNLTNPALNAEDYNGLASPTLNSSLDDPSNLDINSSGQANSIPNTDIPNSNVNSYNEDYNRFASPAASSDTIYSTDIPTLNADAYDDYNGFASPAAASHSNSSLDDPSNPPWFNSSGQANTISNMDETASLPTSDFDDSFDNPSIPEIIADEQANAIPTLNTASLDVDCCADSGRDDSSTDTSIVNTASFESDSEHYPDTDDDSPSNSDLENPLLDSDPEDPQSESTEESNLIFFINWSNIYSLDQKPGTLEAKSVFSGEVKYPFSTSLNPNHRIFYDENFVYFQKRYNQIEKIKISDGSIEKILPGTDFKHGFCLDKPESKGIYFIDSSALHGLKYFNFESNEITIDDRKSLSCPEDETPEILFKSNDGLKLFYKCHKFYSISHKVYFRSDINSNPVDTYIFDLDPIESLKLSPDDRYAIIYGDANNFLKIINLTNEILTPKFVKLPRHLGSFLTSYFSNDGKTIFILDYDCVLIQFNFEKMASDLETAHQLWPDGTIGILAKDLDNYKMQKVSLTS